MSKKLIILMALLVAVFSCVYANSPEITAKISPYSFQFVKTESRNFSSSYGFGVEAGYRHNIPNGLSVGADARYSFYKYSNEGYRYHVLSFMLTAGYVMHFGDKWSLRADFGAGIQERMVGSASGVFFGMNLYVGAGYAISQEARLTGGLDCGLAFQKGSTDISADVMLGLSIDI